MNASEYRFDAVAVKEPKFEIDGVFLPPDPDPGVVYFCEVQFQRDNLLYERLFGESFLYFYRNRRRFTDWQAVIIYPTRSLEPIESYPYRSLLQGEQVHRIYLDELGAIADLPLGVALMALTTVDETEAPAVARLLVERSRQEPPPEKQAIIGMITTILVYKFTHLSRREVEEMLNITLQETRLYQELKQEGREEGREEATRSLVLRQLSRRVGTLPDPLLTKVTALSLTQIEALAEALLDFHAIADLETWMEKLSQ